MSLRSLILSSYIFVNLVSGVSLIGIGQARAQEAFTARPFISNLKVRINSKWLNGRLVDQLRIEDAIVATIPTTPSDSQTALAFSQLTRRTQEDIQEIRRDLIVTSVKAVFSGRLAGPMVMQDDRALVIVPSEGLLRHLGASPAQPLDALKTDQAGLKKFVKMASDAVFTSTIDAAKHYGQSSDQMKGRVVEAGLSLNFKLELSLGVGGLNFSKAAGMVLDVGYNHEHREFVFHYAFRREKQAGGIATPSAKAEIRFYQMTDIVDARSEFTGKSWYPPAVPLLSAVFDSAGPYRAQGLVFGFTAGDFVGLSVANTENEFDEIQHRKVWLTVSGPVDVVLMTMFRAVWVPLHAVYKVVVPPTAATVKFTARQVATGAKFAAAKVRSCKAVLTKKRSS